MGFVLDKAPRMDFKQRIFDELVPPTPSLYFPQRIKAFVRWKGRNLKLQEGKPVEVRNLSRKAKKILAIENFQKVLQKDVRGSGCKA